MIGNYAGGHALRIVVGIAALVLLMAGGAGAAILTVDDSGGADYDRIQDAVTVNNASAHLSAESAQSSIPINFGETISGSIDFAGDNDSYTFSAGSGDNVLIRMRSNFDHDIKLYAPNGSLISSRVGYYFSEITQTLQDNGQYTILAGGESGYDTGSYVIYIQRLNNPANPISIGFGENKSAYINSTAVMNTYTFSASSGDSILIRMRSSWHYYPQIRLYSPNGTLISSASTYGISEITQTLQDNGEYKILAGDKEGDDTGSYELFIKKNEPEILGISPNHGGNAGVVSAVINVINVTPQTVKPTFKE